MGRQRRRSSWPPRHPRRSAGIVCVDGGWLEPGRGFPDWESCRSALAPPRLVGRPLTEVEGYVRSAHADWPETGIRGALANFEVRPDGTIAPWLTLRASYPRAARPLGPPAVAALPDGRVPVLLVPADSGRAIDAERKRTQVDAAAGRDPAARVRWFAGDHDIHAQHPDEVADLMHRAVVDGFFA